MEGSSLRRGGVPFKIAKAIGGGFMAISFVKMHGLGNDFVVVDGRNTPFYPDKNLCLWLADRHRGVGYDQLIVLGKPEAKEADLSITIYNADGSVAGACGNGTRCVAKLFFEEAGRNEAIIETQGGLLAVAQPEPGLYSVVFGPPRLRWEDIPLASPCDTLMVATGVADLPDACCVNVGNPHAVFFVENADDIDLATVGPVLENHALFPERCNIEFAHLIDRKHIRMRVWERGTGITQACGSAALATVVAAVRRELAEREVFVHMDGGDLRIQWQNHNGALVLMGPATTVFSATIMEDLR